MNIKNIEINIGNFFILIDFIFMKARTFQCYVLLLDHQ